MWIFWAVFEFSGQSFGKDATGPLAAWQQRYFPELGNRSTWDRNCEDWPERVGSEVQNVAMRSFKEKGFARVHAQVKIPAESGETFAHLQDSVKLLLSDATRYKEWVLPRINENPDGGKYFVDVENLMGAPISSVHKHAYLLGDYVFRLLWIERPGRSRVDFFHEEALAPDCKLFSSYKSPLSHWFYRMAPRPGLLDNLAMDIWMLPDAGPSGEQRLRLRLAAQPAALIYQLMPEKMLSSQLELRARRIFENFVDLRRRASVPKDAVILKTIPFENNSPGL